LKRKERLNILVESFKASISDPAPETFEKLNMRFLLVKIEMKRGKGFELSEV